jgi:hypothetical protein
MINSELIPVFWCCGERRLMLDGCQCPECGKSYPPLDAELNDGRRVRDLPEETREMLAVLWTEELQRRGGSSKATMREAPKE